MKPPADALRELERQVERGELFTHSALSAQAERINEIEAFLYGLIDVLVEGSVASPDGLRGAAARVREEIDARRETAAPGMALRLDTDVDPEPRLVNCAERMPVCKAVCCRLDFALSREEVEAGRVRWDLGRPYFIRHAPNGYCHHSDAETHGCTVYDDRPRVCRRYSCAGDTRIWKDFDKMELNQQWLDTHVGPDSPKLLVQLMHRKADLVDPRRAPAATVPAEGAAPSEPAEPTRG